VCKYLPRTGKAAPRKLANEVADNVGAVAGGRFQSPSAPIDNQNTEENKGDEEIEDGNDKCRKKHLGRGRKRNQEG